MDSETSQVLRARRVVGRPGRGDHWLHLTLAACGAVPWLGYAVRGEWDETDLSIGVLLLLFSVPKAAAALVAGIRDKPSAR